MTKKEYLELLQKSAKDGTFPGYDTEKGICRYQVPGSKQRCAIGVAIPDEVYQNTSRPESRSLQELLKDYGWKDYLPEGVTARVASSIQEQHDDCCRPDGTFDSDKFIERIRSVPYFEDVLEEVPL